MTNALSPTGIKVAIAAVTMAFAVLGFSITWSQPVSGHGSPEVVVMALASPFLGAVVARKVVSFHDGRTVLAVLVGLGAAVGLWVGMETCVSCRSLILAPAGLAWVAACCFVGAFVGALPRVPDRFARAAGWVPIAALAGVLLVLLNLAG